MGNVSEPDYPKSAPDPMQPGGVIWKFNYLTLKRSASTDRPLCPQGQNVDPFCSTIIHDAYSHIAALNGASNTTEVTCVCGSELKMINQTNTLIKEDVCKITEKSKAGQNNTNLYNVKVCKAVKANAHLKNDTVIDLYCNGPHIRKNN
uniref:Uncharacterized protein n=1 Tax=Cacopsylla melanoneura TaxID=428564 RepID=A0A8D8QI55_9HEMI